MEKSIRTLCQFCLELAVSQEALSSSRLSLTEVQTLFGLVDVKQKGYLDLKDVHDLIGKTTQEQMFAVFKFLDTGRSGEIGVSQFTAALADPSLTSGNTSKEYLFPRFYAMVDAVKDRPQVVEQLRRKYCLTHQQLSGIYELVGGQVGSKYVTAGDLAAVMRSYCGKWGLKWSAGVEKVLGEVVGQNVALAKFLATFGVEGEKKDGEKKEDREVSPISRWEESSQVGTTSTVSRYQQAIQQKNAKILQKKTSSYVSSPHRQPHRQPYIPPHREYEPQLHRQSEPIRWEDPSQLDTPSFKNIITVEPAGERLQRLQSCVDDVLSSIQQRRERLRQDSQDRKRLIQEVMQRKKMSCGLNVAEEWEGKEWESREMFSRTAATPLAKKAAPYKSYIQPSPIHSPASTMDNFYKREEKANYPVDSPSDVKEYPSHRLHKNSSQPKLSPDMDVALLDRPPSALPYDVNDLLRKYGENCLEKQLNKSKSGCFMQNYMPKGKVEEKGYRRDWGNSVSKVTVAAKENVMRRAEEEAARKIEEIERRARMKVLERKNQVGRAQREEEWGRSRPLY